MFHLSAFDEFLPNPEANFSISIRRRFYFIARLESRGAILLLCRREWMGTHRGCRCFQSFRKDRASCNPPYLREGKPTPHKLFL